MPQIFDFKMKKPYRQFRERQEGSYGKRSELQETSENLLEEREGNLVSTDQELKNGSDVLRERSRREYIVLSRVKHSVSNLP